jgi:ribose transport system ATP-binding protein
LVSKSISGSDERAAGNDAATAPVALSFEGVTKTYPGVRALSDVSVEFRAGEIHGLVGENGAGKSTLMSIGAGSVEADHGEVRIAGSRLDRPSPMLARQLGLAIVYQEPALMPDLTVAENIAIGSEKEGRPGWWSAPRHAEEILAAWTRHRQIDPTLPVRDLGPDTRFIIEISKAFAQRPRVLLLDEPTEHLAADDVVILFEQIRELAARGTAVVYISHRIPEVQQICDRISVLRDGVLQGTFEAAEVTQEEIVNRIVGRSLETEFPSKRSATAPLGEPVLAASGLRGERFEGIDLEVHAGEIVGLAGVEGNGQRELIRALAGLVPAQGELRVDDRSVRLGNNAAASASGIAFVPGDRHREGMFNSLGVRENIAAGNLKRYSDFGFMRAGKERSAIVERVRSLDVKAPSTETTVDSLSGGNQQKTVFGRVLERRPRVILADEPTQGVDIGARLEIYRLIRDGVDAGSCAVIVASDGAELEGLCDRVLVLSRGQIVKELSDEEVTEQKMTEAALTSTTSRTSEVTVKNESPLLRFFRGDLAPPVITLAVAVGLGIYTSTQNSFFLTGAAFTGILMLFAALAFASMAQQVVLIAGGIDLSVGPLMGFIAMVASFVIVPERSQGALALGWLLLIAIAFSVGTINWAPTRVGIPPFLTTLVTYTGLQGFSLLLRKNVGGEINLDVLNSISTKIGFVPWAAIAAVVIGLILEYVLRRTTWGVSLRAVGSSPEHAHAVGIRVGLIQLTAYLAGAGLVFLASLLLMSQVGAGDPTAGISYTLTSITAVVIGGASIFGGRGAFVGALAGGFLIVLINASVTFLNLNTAWQTYMLGILTLLAAGIYSKVRDVNA